MEVGKGRRYSEVGCVVPNIEVLMISLQFLISLAKEEADPLTSL